MGELRLVGVIGFAIADASGCSTVVAEWTVESIVESMESSRDGIVCETRTRRLSRGDYGPCNFGLGRRYNVGKRD